MRTTLELPDEIFRKVKAKAAMEGITLKQLLADYVSKGLEGTSSVARPKSRSKLPVIKRRGGAVIPNLTTDLQATLQEDEDFAKLSRSFRR